MVVVPHLNAEEKKKTSEEKKMIMGKSQEDRIRSYLDNSMNSMAGSIYDISWQAVYMIYHGTQYIYMIYHGRQYATADNVFDYFANYQVISESGQYTLHLPGTL